MAKKKLTHHITHLTATSEDKTTDAITKKQEGTAKTDRRKFYFTNKEAEPKEEEPTIRHLYMVPAGFPIKPFDSPDHIQIIVRDPKLFQAYASEQWMGLTVDVNDYIFDQLIIPDFAFKITKIIPKNMHQIGIDTEFHLILQEYPKPSFGKIDFTQIIGNKQAIEKARIIVEYIKDPQKFGKWAPKNILFHGSPGTGKTLTAKAIANEADCTFIARKGTSLIGIHVGDGAAKIHGLFAEARAHTPAIIFVDEVDSIGLSRSFQNVRGDVVEVATALLSELDGLEENANVIFIAATNSIDLIDPGLRSRFEEEIDFPLPEESERKDLLQLFCKDAPIPIEVDFPLIAHQLDKWSGRDIHEKLMKVAIHRAIKQKLPTITTNLLMEIIQQIQKQQKGTIPPSGLYK